MRAVRSVYLFGLVLAAVSSAQQKDLTSLSLEDFLNIEVTSVDKSPEKLARTPAAVFVITQDDIRRSGATSLPEVLRLAPGVSVAQISGNGWAVSIRGFGNVYSNKLLVLVDGRTVYSALLSGTLWGEEIIMLEDVERIEIIRGPGATMWGANAVSGVINIITRSSKNTKGGLAAVSAGSSSRVRSRMRYGGSIGENASWRGWLQYTLQDQPYVPELGRRLAPWSTGRGGLRFDWDASPRDSVLVEGEIERNESESPIVASSQPQAGPTVMNTFSGNGYVMGRWTHIDRRGDTSTLQASFNEEIMHAVVFSARVGTLDADWHESMPLGRHTLMFGAGARLNTISTQGTPALRFDPPDRNYGLLSGFVQDEWQLAPDRLALTIGAKVEHYSLAGTTVQPTARLMWTPRPSLGYWISVSRAVRTPSHTDYAVRYPYMVPGASFGMEMAGSDALRPEVLEAYEAGTRFRIGRAWAFDVAAFRHRYDGLDAYRVASLSARDFAAIAAGAPPTLTATAVNGLDGWNQGVEAVAMYQVHSGWQLSGSYSGLFTRTRFRSGLNQTNAFVLPTYTPENQAQVRSSWDFGRRWSADVMLYRIGELTGGALPAYTRLDCRLARRFGESAEFSISGQNLLRPDQREFAGNLIYPAGLIGRNIEAGVRWTF